MMLNLDKTVNMNVEPVPTVPMSTIAEMDAMELTYQFPCKNRGCTRRFKTSHGERVHASKCRFASYYSRDEYKIGRIYGARGSRAQRFLRVHWEGYPDDHDKWMAESSLLADNVGHIVEDYWSNSSLDRDAVIEKPGDHRCTQCCWIGKRAQDLKTHHRNAHKERQRVGSQADKDVRAQKARDHSRNKAVVTCNGRALKNVTQFVYLGSLFHANGGDFKDVNRRRAIALNVAGQMRRVWKSKRLPISMKIQVYITAVCSVLVYGCESWLLTRKVVQRLNGFNSQVLSWMTKKSVREEASSRTRSFDLVNWIRVRRLKFLGRVLRMEKTRPMHRLVKYKYANRLEGDLLSDAPNTDSFENLIDIAKDKTEWGQVISALKGITIRIK